MKVYRNVFFTKEILQNGHGDVDIQYYGQLYSNAKTLKDLNKLYDRSLDLVISCSSCAAKKYRRFIKVNRP